MSKKSRIFLGLAAAALTVTLVSRLLHAPSLRDPGDFTAGLGAALLFGVLLTWRRPESRRG